MKKNIKDLVSNIVIIILFINFIYVFFAPIYDKFFPSNSSIPTESVVNIDWNREFPFDGTSNEIKSSTFSFYNRYLDKVYSVKDRIKSYAEKIPYKELIAKNFQKLLEMFGYTTQLSDIKDDIIYMKNGYFTFVTPKVEEKDIEEIADSIYDFEEYLKSINVPFLYVNIGNKNCPYNCQVYPENTEFSNENADYLLNKLRTYNVDYLDFRDKMILENKDWFDAYYITDHHWKTETGLWAADILAQELNEKYNFSFNKSLYDKSNFNMTEYENYWLGSQGRKDFFARSQLESFTLITPKYDTNYSISVPNKNLELNGKYEETLLDLDHFNAVGNYTAKEHLNKGDAYNSSRLVNNPVTHVHNNIATNNPGKKICFIQDSCSWYLTGFLASDVEYIDILYPERFNGSIKEYIRKTKPDMVVMMYFERQIDKIDWNTHMDMYDLR